MSNENDTSIQQFQEQVAAARASIQQQKSQKHRLEQRQNQHAQSIGYDPETGMDIIQLADGSILQSAATTTGARGTGDALELHHGEGIAHVDAMPAPKRRKSVEQKKPVEFLPIKILFSVSTDTTTDFYIGGDRKTPTKIFTIPVKNAFYGSTGISSTGKKKNDWIVGICYKLKTDNINNNYIITTIYGNDSTKNWTLPPHPANSFLVWRGYGFWVSDVFSPQIGTSSSETIKTGDIDLVRRLRNGEEGPFRCTAFQGGTFGGAFSSGGTDYCAIYEATGPTTASSSEGYRLYKKISSNSLEYDYTLGSETEEFEIGSESVVCTAPVPAAGNYGLSCTEDNVNQTVSGVEISFSRTYVASRERRKVLATQLVSFSAFEGKLNTQVGELVSKQNSSNSREQFSGLYSTIHGASCDRFAIGIIFDIYTHQWIGYSGARKMVETPYDIRKSSSLVETKRETKTEVFPGVLKPHSSFFSQTRSGSQSSLINPNPPDIVTTTTTPSTSASSRIVSKNCGMYSRDNDSYFLKGGIDSKIEFKSVKSDPTGPYYQNLSTDRVKGNQLAFIHQVSSNFSKFSTENVKMEVNTFEIVPGGPGVLVNLFKTASVKVKSLKEPDDSYFDIHGLSYYPP